MKNIDYFIAEPGHFANHIFYVAFERNSDESTELAGKLEKAMQGKEVIDFGCGIPNHSSNPVPEYAEKFKAKSYTGIEYNLGTTFKQDSYFIDVPTTIYHTYTHPSISVSLEGFKKEYIKAEIGEYLAQMPEPIESDLNKCLVFSGVETYIEPQRDLKEYGSQDKRGRLLHIVDLRSFHAYVSQLHENISRVTKKGDVIISGVRSSIPNEKLLERFGFISEVKRFDKGIIKILTKTN